MGREIRRVPMDFDWPHHKPWKGFINPHHNAARCAACDGSGSSPIARFLKDQWYGNAPFSPAFRGSTPFSPEDYLIRARAEANVERSPEYYGRGPGVVEREAKRLCDHFNRAWSHHLNQADVDALVEAGRLMDFTHEWKRGDGWTPKIPAYHPTAAEVNEWSLNGLSHDSINQWVVVKAECARMGVDTLCVICGGDGEVWPSEGDRIAYETWTLVEPPAGDGWQVWETVSEGSPISPVFATPDEVAEWLVGEGHSRAGAEAFVKSGYAPSGIGIEGVGFMNGIDALGELP